MPAGLLQRCQMCSFNSFYFNSSKLHCYKEFHSLDRGWGRPRSIEICKFFVVQYTSPFALSDRLCLHWMHSTTARLEAVLVLEEVYLPWNRLQLTLTIRTPDTSSHFHVYFLLYLQIAKSWRYWWQVNNKKNHYFLFSALGNAEILCKVRD